jgi:hypothetical protein
VAGRIRSIEKSLDLTGNRTHDLPARSIVPQPTMLLPVLMIIVIIVTSVYFYEQIIKMLPTTFYHPSFSLENYIFDLFEKYENM